MNREMFDKLKGLLNEIDTTMTSIKQTFDDVEFTMSEKTNQEIAYDFDVEDIVIYIDSAKDLLNDLLNEIENID